MGGRSRRDSKLLVWTDGRTVAPLAQLSWGLGRLGGGEAREFRFVHVEGERAGGGLRKGSYDGEFRLPLVLAQASPIFHSSCEGKLGIALE